MACHLSFDHNDILFFWSVFDHDTFTIAYIGTYGCISTHNVLYYTSILQQDICEMVK